MSESIMKRYELFAALLVFCAACGGGEPADTGADTSADTAAAPPAPAAAAVPPPPSGAMTMPDWFQIDNAARTVHMTITAGETPVNNHWNYNGHIRGSMAITVPQGYTVTIDLVNQDPVMGHSIVIHAETQNFAVPLQPTPVFAGAATQNATSMVDSTMPGETETIEFVADQAGTYSMLCTVPGHSAVGMWIYFIVSADETAGVQLA
jgi:uncharacterized cupredoxin-like copper-binding protein